MLRTMRDVLIQVRARRSPAPSGAMYRTSGVAQMLDHFVQYVGSSPFNPTCRAVRDRPHAGGWRRVVPARRHKADTGVAAGVGARSGSKSTLALA